MAKIRHLILDRDGVLNVEDPAGGWVDVPEKLVWIPGSLDALRRLAETDLRISVVTNQSLVGRGLASIADVERVHDRLLADCVAAGGRIDRIHVCPHAPGDGCACRKPLPGLVHRAIEESDCTAEASLLIGDAERDIAAADAAGVPAILVRTGKGAAAEDTLSARGVPVYDDLRTVVDALLDSRFEPPAHRR